MNENLLSELFFGNLVPCNSMPYKTEEYVNASRTTDELEVQLGNTLDKDNTKLLNDLLEAKDTMTDELVFAAFKEGVKLGMGFVIEGYKTGGNSEE